MIIGIDKGHSTYDKKPCGAIGLLNESKENRPLGDKIISKLIQLGHTVIDCSVDSANSVESQLELVVNRANYQKLDLFLSLHLNAGGGTGAEIYTTSTSSAKVQAKALIDSYCSATGYNNRGLKHSEFYVLRNTIAPAMLIELCFVDNQQDFKRWENLGYDFIANVIVESITGQKVIDVEYEEVKPKGESKLLKNCKNNVVKLWSKGTYVYMLQSMLTSLGYNVNGIDGNCGTGMVNAIKQYQRDNGLAADGSFGPASWENILTK